jgi:hypothetical protein
MRRADFERSEEEIADRILNREFILGKNNDVRLGDFVGYKLNKFEVNFIILTLDEYFEQEKSTL